MTQPVAFITGVSRGIGAELAVLLLADGYEVHGCATRAAWPDGVYGSVCDVSRPDDVQALFADLASRVSSIDLLVNNAALLGPRTEIEHVEPAAWQRVFAVNADGPFFVTQCALPLLRAAARATIVNISSSVGRRGRGGWGPYACSKHALEGLTDVLAEELRDDGIVVLSLNPGGTATEMRADAFPDEDPESLPTAAEIAQVIMTRAQQASLDDTGAKWNCRDFL